MTTVFARNRAGAGVRRPHLRTPSPEDYYIERDKNRDLTARLETLQGHLAKRDETIAAQKSQLAALQAQLVRLQAGARASEGAPQAQPQPVKRRGRPPKHARHHPG